MLSLASLRCLCKRDSKLFPEAKKILGSPDNRQDTALQSGHFNDSLQVLQIRAALLSAVDVAGGKPLTERDIANSVFESLGFDRDDHSVHVECMKQPDVKGNSQRQVQEAKRVILE
jgi:hypothetical protein